MSEVIPRYWLPSGTLTQQHPYGLDDTCVVPDWAYDKLKKDYDQLRAELAALKAGQGDLDVDRVAVCGCSIVHTPTLGGNTVIFCANHAARKDWQGEAAAWMVISPSGYPEKCTASDPEGFPVYRAAPPASADAVSVLIELIDRIVPRIDAGGQNPIDEKEHPCEWVLHKERERIHAEFRDALQAKP